MDQRWIEHKVAPEEAGETVEKILTGPLQLSRRMLQRLTRSNGIQLNRRRTHLSRRVRSGDVVAARASAPESSGLAPVEMPLDVVYEDADVLLVNKPPFLLVHPFKPAHTRTLAHGVAYHFQRQGVEARVRPVHRIDRDTSGLVLFAKSAYAHQHLDRQLRERELKREYLALVQGRIAEDTGRIEAPIGKHPRHPHLRAVRPEAGEKAITHFRVVERFPEATLVRLELETGRTHQIRVHLAHLGHPLLGDLQYAGPRVPGLRRQALHAFQLTFVQPASGEPIVREAPLPQDLEQLRHHLRGEEPV